MQKIGVSVSSFNVYKNEHPELLEALKNGKIVADDEVEAALYRRAVGYSYENELNYRENFGSSILS